MVGGVDSVKTRLGDVNEIEYDRLVEAAGELYELPLAIDDCGSMTVHELRSRIMRFARKNPMDIVFIDYLQFIRGSDMRMQRKDQVSEISKVLKGMAKDLDMPVVALAQLNRNPTDRRDHTPVISDLKESGEIEQDADIVLMLHRPDYYDEHDRPDELDVIIGKNRNGPTGPVRMFYNRSTSHFGELER